MAGTGPPTAGTRSRGCSPSSPSGNLVGIFICLWLAAGYTLEDFLAPVGLSGLFR
jgi:hypothetical protein